MMSKPTRSFAAASLAAGILLSTACSNGGGSTVAPIVPTAAPTSAPTATPTPVPTATSAGTSTTAIANGATVQFPAVGGYSGSIVFPSSGVPAGEMLTLTNASTVPPNAPTSFAPAAKARRIEASTATLIPPYIVATLSVSLTLPGIPAVAFTLPATPPANTSFLLGLFDITSTPQAVAVIAGAVSKNSITFGPYTQPVSFVAGHTYFLGLYSYATPTATATPSPAPTATPTGAPTSTPTATPTASPTLAPTATPTASPTTTPTAVPTASPTASASPFATSTTPISAAGGTLSLPSFGGFSGTIGYPTNNAPSGVNAVLVSSTTNLGTLPSAPGAIFYEQFQLSGSAQSVTFNSGTASGTFASTALSPTKSYTLYVYIPALAGNTPYATQSLGSPSAGSISFTSPISGITVPVGVNVVLELSSN